MSMFGESLSDCQSYEIADLKSENFQLNEKRKLYVGRIIELECAIKWLINEALKTYDDEQPVKKGMRKILEQGSIPPLDPKEIKV